MLRHSPQHQCSTIQRPLRRTCPAGFRVQGQSDGLFIAIKHGLAMHTSLKEVGHGNMLRGDSELKKLDVIWMGVNNPLLRLFPLRRALPKTLGRPQEVSRNSLSEPVGRFRWKPYPGGFGFVLPTVLSPPETEGATFLTVFPGWW